MTNGPDARLAEIVEVKIPRPRTRAQIIDDPEYGRLRSHIIHFLVERSRQLQEQATGAGPSLTRGLPPPTTH
jgi:nitrate/nitrite transport system ATP-binding protein